MMRVYEAWSPEDSQLIFKGNAAINTVRAAVDAVYQDPTLQEPEIDSLINLSEVIDSQMATSGSK